MVTSFTFSTDARARSRCCSPCPGPGRRRPGWSPPGSPGRRTRRTRCGPTCTWRRRPAARPRPSRSAAATWAAIAGAANLLNQLYAKVGSSPSSHFLSFPQSFLNAMLAEAGCSSLGYQACHLPWYASGGKLDPPAAVRQVRLLHHPAEQLGISTLLAGIVALQRVAGAAGGVGGIAFDALGGAVNRVKPGATAFVHRNALFDAQYTTDWTNGAGSRGDQQPARLAAQVLVLDAPLRQRPGLPELHRPGPDQLAAGLLRRQLPPPAPASRRSTTPPASSPSPRPSGKLGQPRPGTRLRAGAAAASGRPLQALAAAAPGQPYQVQIMQGCASEQQYQGSPAA